MGFMNQLSEDGKFQLKIIDEGSVEHAHLRSTSTNAWGLCAYAPAVGLLTLASGRSPSILIASQPRRLYSLSPPHPTWLYRPRRLTMGFGQVLEKTFKPVSTETWALLFLVPIAASAMLPLAEKWVLSRHAKVYQGWAFGGLGSKMPTSVCLWYQKAGLWV